MHIDDKSKEIYNIENNMVIEIPDFETIWELDKKGKFDHKELRHMVTFSYHMVTEIDHMVTFYEKWPKEVTI